MATKIALITGGSSGIGLEFSRLMAQKGYDLILSSRNQERLAANKLMLEENYGVKVIVIPVDLSQNEGPKQLWDACQEMGLKVNILINNAGAGFFGKAIDLDYEKVQHMLFLNIQALTTLCMLFGKSMQEQGHGSILNVGSMAGNQPTPFFASYASSKSYVLHYSLALRQEYKPYGVNVSCVQYGYVRTAFDDNMLIKNEAYKKFSQANSISAEKAAKIGLRMLFRKKAFGIAGFGNKIANFFSGLMPKGIQAVIIHKFMLKYL